MLQGCCQWCWCHLHWHLAVVCNWMGSEWWQRSLDEQSWQQSHVSSNLGATEQQCQGFEENYLQVVLQPLQQEVEGPLEKDLWHWSLLQEKQRQGSQNGVAGLEWQVVIVEKRRCQMELHRWAVDAVVGDGRLFSYYWQHPMIFLWCWLSLIISFTHSILFTLLSSSGSWGYNINI